MKKIILTLMVFIIILSLSSCDNAELLEPVDVNNTAEVDFIVPAGAGTKAIASALKEQALIQKSYAFTSVVKRLGLDGKLKAGHYKLAQSMNTEEIAQIIGEGKVFIDTFKFTIPEGYEFEMIVDKLVKEGLINKNVFIDIAENHSFNYKFLESDREYVHRLEGFMYPATYELKTGSDELAIITAILEAFNQNFSEDDYQRTEALGFSVNQLITLASIVERECMSPEELTLISSVFHNRLKAGQMLEACSTVQYITKERKEVMLFSDIAIDTPYNTYKYSGLPPSPIASPGVAAIKATLYPEQSDYLYFVVTGDNDGRHNFSKTYEEHLKNQHEAERKLGR